MIKFNEVTWYSRLGAIILFVGVVPASVFYIGVEYGRFMQLEENLTSSSNTNIIQKSPSQEELPTGIPTGKININAVCEGALSYMSFPDGASADTFVAECKEGKYPEVIEKYKVDLNLGDGAAI